MDRVAHGCAVGHVTREISQHELRNHSGAILRAGESGEDFVVTRNGTALAELRPLRRPDVDQSIERDR